VTQDQCWALLRGAQLGRVAFASGESIEIMPIDFVVDHGSVVFRTDSPSTAAAAASGRTVAFESDGYLSETSEAWSVVLKGQLAEILHLDDVLATFSLPLYPSQPGRKAHFMRLAPVEITGRRFTVAQRPSWATTMSGLRPGATP
jgi:nitroimidazol reductase NimA-like FMN-containing flavoprotein (pyridoxamine 5'-phosphate oxidase superfamily)